MTEPPLPELPDDGFPYPGTVEHAALAELLRRRFTGPTITMDEMDRRIERMIERKRRELGLPD